MTQPAMMSIVRDRRRATRTDHPALWSVVLAAGASLRLGRPKQLVRLSRETLIARAVRLAERATPGRVVVVLGAHALRIRAHLRRSGLRPRLVYNRDWRSGQSTSLRRGIARVPRQARATLVLLCDQPQVGGAAIMRLLRAWRAAPTRSVASEYAGRLGAPAVLPRRERARLELLRGDRGARELLRGSRRVTAVALPEAALDIDTPADLARLR